MRAPFRVQATALLLAMVMPLAQGHAAEDGSDITEESLRQEIQNLNQALADVTTEQREQLMTDIEDVLEAIDSRIATLNSRMQAGWSDADRLARAETQTTMAALRRHRGQVEDWVQRMQASTEFTWDSMKENFDDAFDDLTEAWQNAEQDIRQAIKQD